MANSCSITQFMIVILELICTNTIYIKREFKIVKKCIKYQHANNINFKINI